MWRSWYTFNKARTRRKPNGELVFDLAHVEIELARA